MTVFYRIVVEVIHVTLIVTLIADEVFPKTPLPNASFSLPPAPLGKSFPRGNLGGKACLDIVPAGGEIRLPGRLRPDTMQVIGQNDDGLDSEWSPLAGRLECRPEKVNVFGQEVPAPLQ
jgi:hypothetical protein